MKASRPAPLRPTIQIEDGRKVLRVGGFIQSVQVGSRHRPDFWDALIPDRDRVTRALLLGLGGGTVATLLARRFGSIAITAVEYDPQIVDIATQEFGLGHLENLRIVVADAFAFVRKHEGRYDLICVDLYRGRWLPREVLSCSFLRNLLRILDPAGITTFNFWLTPGVWARLRRLHSVLPVRELVLAEENVVARCSPGVVGRHPVCDSATRLAASRKEQRGGGRQG